MTTETYDGAEDDRQLLHCQAGRECPILDLAIADRVRPYTDMSDTSEIEFDVIGSEPVRAPLNVYGSKLRLQSLCTMLGVCTAGQLLQRQPTIVPKLEEQ